MRIKPKKSLGQNFLIDQNIQKKIISYCALKPSDVVLEIGSGRGELTRLIAAKAAYVFALELDSSLVKILENNLADYRNINLINKDILKFDLNECFSSLKKEKGPNLAGVSTLKVIGNIPYYITSPIIEYLINYLDKINAIFLTVQKEVAQRLVASAGSKEYGSFSCFVQYYTRPEIIFYIKKNCFSPAPKVDSGFVMLKIEKSHKVKVLDEKHFFKIIRSAFNKRRKILRNSLQGVVSEELLEGFFRKYNIDCKIRPERMTLENFADLANL